jgi:hypothetical protein
VRRDLELCSSESKERCNRQAAPDGAGDIWTWTAFDANNQLILSRIVGGRDAGYALDLMDDVRKRLANCVQLTTDAHGPYLRAVEEAFGADIDYAMLVKL